MPNQIFEKQTKHDSNLEALRGFAATIVVIYHLIIHSSKLNGGFEFKKNIIHWSPSGHLMVLVFFMLSGYVIGKSYANKPNFNTIGYLKKRLIRLYPIYLFSILFTIALFREDIRSIIGNIFLVQNLFTNCLTKNDALWSLNHEILYYLFAILLLKYKINSQLLLFVFSFLLLATFKIDNIPCIIQDYLVGFIFWLSGYILSTFNKIDNYKPSVNKLISVMLLLLGCDLLNLFARIVNFNLKIPNQISFYTLTGIVKIGDFCLFPYALYAVIIFSSINFRYIKILTWFVYLNSIAHLVNLLFNHSFFKTEMFYIPTVFISLSLFFHFMTKPLRLSLQYMVNLGSISYAIYVIHYPILYTLSKIKVFTGTTLSYFIRVLIFTGIVILISFLLEKKLQPLIKKKFT